jgi:hypothetical protein
MNKSACKTYFIQGVDGGPIKIGKSKDVARRLSDMQGHSPVRLAILGVINSDIEEYLHKKFSHLRIRREWFSPDNSLIEFIKSNCSSSGKSEKDFEELDDFVEVFKRTCDRRSKTFRSWLFGLIKSWADLGGDFCDAEEDELDECVCDVCCAKRGVGLLLDSGIKELGICKIATGEMPCILCSVIGIDKLKLGTLVDAWWEFDYAGIDLNVYYYESGDLVKADLHPYGIYGEVA